MATATYINSWKPDEDTRLRQLAATGAGKYTIGHAIGRSPGAVERRAALLGIQLPIARVRSGHYEGWNEERAERAKKLWEEGKSANDIAMVLGGGITRNAVIGKIHRLGCAHRAPVGPRKSRKRRRMLRTIVLPRHSGNPILRKILEDAPPIPEMPELEIPLAERKSVATLEDTHCRWPIGDPQHADFHFCGKTQVTGLPYCESHARRAYNSVAVRSPRPQSVPQPAPRRHEYA